MSSIIMKKLYVPFLSMGFNYLNSRATLRRLFTTKFPKIYVTSFIDLEKMEGWVDLWANTGPLDRESSALTTRLLLHI